MTSNTPPHDAQSPADETLRRTRRHLLTAAAGVVGTVGVAAVPLVATARPGSVVQGTTGPAGPTGAPGAPGVTGVRGATGQMGPVGPMGPQGNRGATGPTGDAGQPGVVGIPGEPGVPGGRGATGATGVTPTPAHVFDIWTDDGLGFSARATTPGATVLHPDLEFVVVLPAATFTENATVLYCIETRGENPGTPIVDTRYEQREVAMDGGLSVAFPAPAEPCRYAVTIREMYPIP